MQDDSGGVRFVTVNEKDLVDFLYSAERRIVIAKTGYRCTEIETLIDIASKRGIDCTIYVDPDENVVRWGFGQKSALVELQKNKDLLRIQTVDHIRIAVVIVDDQALFFVPVALSWEREPEKWAFPNGFFAGPGVAEGLLAQISGGEELPRSNKVIPFPGCSVPQKHASETTKEISEAIDKLEKNPPVDPSKLRRITVYRNKYKLLKYQIKGVKIKNRSLNLRSFNSLFPNLSQRLKASWQVFTKEDMEKVWEIGVFLEEIEGIVDRYALDMGRFGHLMKTEDRTKFENEINREKEEFLDVLKLKPNGSPKNKDSKYLAAPDGQRTQCEQNKNRGITTLGTLLAASRAALKDYMRQVVQDHPACLERLFENERTLFNMVKRKEIPVNEATEGVLDIFITEKLKFPQAEDLVDKMDITLDYYDVSNELLHENEEFMGKLEEIKRSRAGTDDVRIRDFSDAFQSEG